MKFNVFTEKEYTVQSAGTLILNISALRTQYQTVLVESFTVDPDIKIEELTTAEGENRLIRLAVADKSKVKVSYKATVDNYYTLSNHEHREEMPVSRFDASIMTYLYPSRYCQSDQLYRLARNMFGHIDHPFSKVIAITDWIHANVQYKNGATDTHTSAYDTITQQIGVCRDFAHLGIALCRALTIPARYFTAYAYQLKPADFHACFEAYLDGEWVLFDATKRAPLNGMVKIATGRDATDAAIANIFGGVRFASMTVTCELADEGFEPVYYNSNEFMGLAYS